MIKDRNEYRTYLEKDRKALGIDKKIPAVLTNEIWKFERILRKTEYVCNCFDKKIFFLYIFFLKWRYHKISTKLGFSIPLNVFEEGLSIAHYGNIVVNGGAHIGKNCRIQEGVNIGSTAGSAAPRIGDNVFIGSGAKIIGDIIIGDNIAIGANAVVINSFTENHITIAGIPAKKVSNNDSSKFLKNKFLCD